MQVSENNCSSSLLNFKNLYNTNKSFKKTIDFGAQILQHAALGALIATSVSPTFLLIPAYAWRGAQIGALIPFALALVKKINTLFYPNREYRKSSPMAHPPVTRTGIAQIKTYMQQGIDKHFQPNTVAYNALKAHIAAEKKRPVEEISDHDVKAFLNDEVTSYSQLWLKQQEGASCYGEQRTLLNMMVEGPHRSCEELVQAMPLEDVYFIQFTQYLSQSIKGNDAFLSMARLFGRLKDDDILARKSRAEIIQKCAFAHQTNIDKRQTSGDSPVAFTEINTVQERLSEELRKQVEEGRIVAGSVSMMGERKKIIDNVEGHTLFYQCSEGNYRYYDPFRQELGFYEFPDRESFIKGLFSHLKKMYGTKFDSGTISFEVFDIQPK